MEKVFLVHGWSVTTTETYQSIHLQLAKNGFQLEEIFLGRYISIDDDVEISDIARAMQYAIDEKLGGDYSMDFHIITHSTGALVTRKWITDHYVGERAAAKGLKNVVFLAPPHFGSRLAHHGKTMLAHAVYFGDTGERVLNGLELASEFSFDLNEQWLDLNVWKNKGIRPYCLIGDKVENSFKDWFESKILPANYEDGSDMVVRACAGNLNHRRYRIEAVRGVDGKFTTNFKEVGRIEGVAYGVFSDYTHSGEKHGILNSITKDSTPQNHKAFAAILLCLKVKNDVGYASASVMLAGDTSNSRKVRKGFAQLDFRFTDQDGNPVEDYVFKMGAIVDGKKRPSKTIEGTHKNTFTGNHFNAYIGMEELEPKYDYFFELDSQAASPLFSFQPDPLVAEAKNGFISEIIRMDQTTQIEVVLFREPDRKLFVFHPGNDPDLHVKFDREGNVTEMNRPAL